MVKKGNMLRYILLLMTLSGALSSPVSRIGGIQASSPPPTIAPQIPQDNIPPGIPSSIPQDPEEPSTIHNNNVQVPSTIPQDLSTVQNGPTVPTNQFLKHLAGIGGVLVGIPGDVVRHCAESCYCNPFRPECASGQRGIRREAREVHGAFYPVGGLGYYGRPYYHGYQHYPYYAGNYYRGYFYYPGSWGYHIRESEENE